MDEPDDGLMTEQELMDYLRVSRGFLTEARKKNQLKNGDPAPPYVKMGGAIRYRKSEISKWLDGLKHN